MTIVIWSGHEDDAGGTIQSSMSESHGRCPSTREPVVITKKCRQVAKLVPAEEPSDDFLGKLSGMMKIVGDITQPIEDPEAWEALR
jgi:hypothetical protein